MRRFWPLFLFLIIFVVAVIGINSQSSPEISSSKTPQRIISLSPSITETVFALGLSDKVVGVTDYCDYPPEVNLLPKVGGFINPNLETIISLQPDLVIMLANQQRVVEQLKQLNVQTLPVLNSSLEDIKQTIKVIGQQTQHQQQADELLNKINQKIAFIAKKTKGLARPRVMITMGHSIDSQHMKQIFIAGQHDFYNDLINLAGGENAYQAQQPNVPSLSVEGIMQLNPQVIIDIYPEAEDHNSDLVQVMHQWNNLKYVDAIQNKRIHLIEENYATIPGPRIFLLLEQLARLIHPEVDWETSAL
jgi:iron complex transport system substrate-binding protein